jgi:hypothetical protein
MKSNIETIEMLYQWALDQSEYVLPREIFYNALFFNTAAAMGLRKIRVRRNTNRGEKITIPNFFGVTFGNSGIGKDHSNNLAKALFLTMFARFESVAAAFYHSKKEMTDDKKPDRRYLNLSSYFIPVSSSAEGLQKAAQTICDMDCGSLNVVSDELGDSITSMDRIFTKLKTGWDTGISEGQVNVSDGGENYFTVNDLCFNALLFGAPAPFELDSKKKEKLLEAYVSGIARRSFIYHNNTYKKSENRNQNFEQFTMNQLEEVDSYIKELKFFINNTEFIEYPAHIRSKLIEYDESRQVIRDKSHSLIAEDLGNSKKIEKLLGIIATLDLSSEINERHLDFAIEFTSVMDATAEETVEIKPIYMQIYNEMEKRSFTARTDIVKAVKDVTLKSLENEMILVEEHANMLGNSIIKKENSGIIRYKLEKLSETSLDKIILSVNTDPNRNEPNGFMKAEGKWENLHTIINSTYRYSAGTFRDNYINDQNYMQEQNLFIIDVDSDMSLDDAKNLFSGMTYLICTTKSHQKEKNDAVCDRFRIILPTISKFHLDYKTYSETYMNVINSLGIPEVDTKCRNASRWYFGYPEGEYWYNEGNMLDVRTFIPDSVEKQSADVALHKYEQQQEHAPADIRIAGAIKWFLSKTSKGNRNDNLFLLCMLLKDPTRIGTPDWQHWAIHANLCLSDPLPERDIKTIISSAERR